MVFDLSGIDSICPLSTLYLLAWINLAKKVDGAKVTGLYPLKDAPAQLFADLGFWNVIDIQANRQPGRVRHAAIRSGESGDGWMPIRDFLVENASPPFSLIERDEIYFAIGELVENVIQHAYLAPPSLWYAVGVRHPGGPAIAAIVDLGVGIPSSVKRRRSLLGTIENWKKSDSDWLADATTGRTRTGEPNRGNGLTRLRDFAQSTNTRELAILSGRGVLTVADGRVELSDETESLPGTLIAFTLRPGERQRRPKREKK